MTRTFGWGLVLITLLGLMLRAWLAASSGWRIDYDEALLGLIALDILDGGWPVFVRGQATLGTLEAYYLAGIFSVSGVSFESLRVLSLSLSAAYIVTTGLLAREAFGKRAGLLAALLASVAPVYALVAGMRVWAGTASTLVYGNLLLWCVARAVRSDQPIRWWGAAGLVGGVLFWTSWQGFFYFMPAGITALVWLARRIERRRLTAMTTAAIFFFVGSLPFWIYNVTHDWATFTASLDTRASTVEERRLIIEHFRDDLVPRLLTGDPSWWPTENPSRTAVLILAYGAGLVWLWAAWLQDRKNPARGMLAGLVVMVPLLYVFSGYARNALNPFGIDATGRYVVMWHSALPVGMAGLAVAARRGWFFGAGLICGVVCLNLLGTLTVDPPRAFDSPYYDRLPRTLDPLIETLNEQGIEYVWTDVGIAQPLMLITEKQILAADYWDAEIAGGLVRFPDVLAAVEAAAVSGERVAYVVPIAERPSRLEQTLNAAEIAYETWIVGQLAVYLPENPLHPSEIATGLGYQY